MRRARALETECAHDAQALRHKLSGCHDYCRRRDAGARRTGPQRIRTVNAEFNDGNDIDDVCNQRAVSGAQWLWLLTDRGPSWSVQPVGRPPDERAGVYPVLGDVPRVDLPRFAPAGHPPGRRPLPAPCRRTCTHTLVRPAPGLPRVGRQQRRVLSALAVNGPLTSCEPLFVASAVASHVSSYCSSLRGFWLDGLSDLIRGAHAGGLTAISTQSSISC